MLDRILPGTKRESESHGGTCSCSHDSGSCEVRAPVLRQAQLRGKLHSQTAEVRGMHVCTVVLKHGAPSMAFDEPSISPCGAWNSSGFLGRGGGTGGLCGRHCGKRDARDND